LIKFISEINLEYKAALQLSIIGWQDGHYERAKTSQK